MNRVELKEKAKKMIAGNKWYIWKPLVMFGLIMMLIGIIFGLILSLLKLNGQTTVIITSAFSTLLSLVGCVFSVGYARYVLDFVRGKKYDWKEVLTFAKEHWPIAVLVSIVTSVFVILGAILLIIPGIIIAIGLTFYQEVCADNPELTTMEIIKKAWAITNKHKLDIFIFVLSFIGWEILAVFTLGILYIWLLPYMTVSLVLVYEELKKAA